MPWGSVVSSLTTLLGCQLRHVEFLEHEIEELNTEIEGRMRPFEAAIDHIDGSWESASAAPRPSWLRSAPT